MSPVKRKVTPTYKQMAFETAVRNPERYKGILTAVQPFENQTLTDDKLLEIVCTLYLNGIVSSDKITITEQDTIQSIAPNVIKVNETRKADGGFPFGYASRFWTYMRTLSELGFVYAQYNEKFQLSLISKKLISNEIDEQEAFSLQAMKYNRKSPYRNILNDFNYFAFIINILKIRQRISYEQFIISTFSQYGDIDQYFEIIDNNTFGDNTEVETFLRHRYKANNEAQTILRDYPDVVLRLLIITGFVSIQYRGKVFIHLNIDKQDYINSLLQHPVNLTDQEKSNATLHFAKLETYNNDLLNVLFEYRKTELKLDGYNYTQKVAEIIKEYELNEELILASIENIGTPKNIVPAFKYIAEPLKLEFFISLLLALKYGNEFGIKPNYKADYIGVPISHAPGNLGDIEVYSKHLYWLIEVTLIRNKAQQLNNETTSVIRHFITDNELNAYQTKYLSFVAPYVHQDTKDYYNVSVVMNKIVDKSIYLKPYDLFDFVDVTIAKNNFTDMEKYTNQIIQDFKNNLQ